MIWIGVPVPDLAKYFLSLGCCSNAVLPFDSIATRATVGLTEMLKVWVAFGFTPLLAVMVIGPAVPAAGGVPDRMLFVKVNQLGLPLTVNVGAGDPDAAMV